MQTMTTADTIRELVLDVDCSAYSLHGGWALIANAGEARFEIGHCMNTLRDDDGRLIRADWLYADGSTIAYRIATNGDRIITAE